MTKVAKALPDTSHKARALEGQADELKAEAEALQKARKLKAEALAIKI